MASDRSPTNVYSWVIWRLGYLVLFTQITDQGLGLDTPIAHLWQQLLLHCLMVTLVQRVNYGRSRCGPNQRHRDDTWEV